MIILVPILIIIALIVAVDHIYFSNVVPKDVPLQKEVHRSWNDANATQEYLNRYIKK